MLMRKLDKKAFFGSIAFYDKTADHVKFLIPPSLTKEDIDKTKLNRTFDAYMQLVTLSNPALRKSEYLVRYAIYDIKLKDDDGRLPTRSLFVFNTEGTKIGTWNFLLMNVDDLNVSATLEDLTMRCQDILGVVRRQELLKAKNPDHKVEDMYERIQKSWAIALLHFLQETEEYSEKADEKYRYIDLQPIGIIEIPLEEKTLTQAKRTWMGTEEVKEENLENANLATVVSTEQMNEVKTAVLDYFSLFSKLCMEFLSGIFYSLGKPYHVKIRPKEVRLERADKPKDFVYLLASIMEDERWIGTVSIAPPEDRFGIEVTKRRQLQTMSSRLMSARRRQPMDLAAPAVFQDFFKRKTLEVKPANITLIIEKDLSKLINEVISPEELEEAQMEVLEMEQLANMRKFFLEEKILPYLFEIIGILASKVAVEVTKNKGIIKEDKEDYYVKLYEERRKKVRNEVFGEKEPYFEILADRLAQSLEDAFRKDVLERISGFEEIKKYLETMKKEIMLEFFSAM